MTAYGAVPRLRFEDAGASTDDDFAQGVYAGLTATPKRLAARYLYDDVGSALYGAIVLLPEYYLTAAETEILTRHADVILECAHSADIAELGPGGGQKTRILLEAALRRHAHVNYRPIDISRDALEDLSQKLVSEYDRLSVTALYGDYSHVLRPRALRTEGTTLLLFLGSSIGNYEPREAIALMKGVSSALEPGDFVLLGADLKKSREELERAYDDPGGVTAAFNRNVLARINRELGGDFDLRKFRYAVRYDEARACVDSFQESTIAQRARIAALSLDIAFGAGERILTESSYKYDKRDIEDLANASGFDVTASWSDEAGRFLVVLLAVRL